MTEQSKAAASPWPSDLIERSLALRAEVERLRQVERNLCDRLEAGRVRFERLEAESERLLAERDALRETLKAIAGDRWDAQRYVDMAREALETEAG